MTASLVVGLSGALLGPLFWLAYNHPAEFKRLRLLLVAVAVLSWVCVGTWNTALVYAEAATSGFLSPEGRVPFRAALAALRLPLWVLVAIGPGLLAYLWVLDAWATKLKAPAADHRDG